MTLLRAVDVWSAAAQWTRPGVLLSYSLPECATQRCVKGGLRVCAWGHCVWRGALQLGATDSYEALGQVRWGTRTGTAYATVVTREL